MKRLLPVVALVAVGIGTAGCAEDLEIFTATLSGGNEVPPVTTSATGTATFTLLDGGMLSYEIVLQSVSNVTAAHIHDGGAGVNGPILVGLYAGPVTGGVSGVLVADTVAVADSVLTRMRNGSAYVNVHTEGNPAGEVRGQIQPSAVQPSTY